MTASQVVVAPTSSLAEPAITKLTPLDQIMPRFNLTMILCIPTRSNDIGRVSSLLKAGLERTITDIPYLPGRLLLDGLGRLSIKTKPRDCVLFRTQSLIDDVSWSFENLRSSGFALSKMKGELLSPLPFFPDPEDVPVMAAQANFVDGGVLLVVCVHHAVADVRGFSSIVETWAKHVSGGGLEKVGLDRSLLMAQGKTVDPANHMEYNIGGPPWAFATDVPMMAKIFRFSAAQLAKLKAEANGEGSWVSTNDALCALLWRSITIARAPSSEKMSTLGFAVDGRLRMDPPLPPSYIGNVNVYGTAMLPLSTLPSTALSTIARSIRAGISRVDDARIRNVIELIDGTEDVTMVRNRWVQFLGTDVDLTSWASIPLNGLDWGSELGKVERVRIPDAYDYDGFCMVLPQRTDGSLEVLIGLRKDHMKRLDLCGFADDSL